MLRLFFITDGAKYHDGDVEEVYGAIITIHPRSSIERSIRNMKKLRARFVDSDALVQKFGYVDQGLGPVAPYPGIRYIPFDWEHSTNVIGMPHD